MRIPESPDLSTFNYHLPDEKIAKRPLANRDDSKLLLYERGHVSDKVFREAPGFLDEHTTLFFNNTKVIPARLHFHKETGAQIEIFLLKPVSPTPIISTVMESTDEVAWECMVGNLKRWKEQTVLNRILIDESKQEVKLEATLVNRNERLVSFKWDNQNYSFAEIVELAGQVPLPPYLNRAAEPEDKPRYQTVYSKEEGAVAAPTAGLHFTDQTLKQLKRNGVKESFLTLHVSAGTFQPIKVDDAREHPMHSEQIEVTIDTIKDIATSNRIVAVGTTSMRSLESLYWFGVRLTNGNEQFHIEKLELYQEDNLPSRTQAFERIYNWMIDKGIDKLSGSTEIFIMPGYQFKVCDGLFTNFHQPGSTLMLLVAAFIGEHWQKVYDHALQNDYRFLSYGDSSLLLP